MSRNVRAFVFALIAVFAASAAVQALPLTFHAGQAGRAGITVESGGLLGAVWSWVAARIAPAVPGLASVWERAGSQMDPNGQPTSDGTDSGGFTSSADEGRSMDPNGGC